MRSLFTTTTAKPGQIASSGVPNSTITSTRSNGTLVGQSVSQIVAGPGPNAFEVGVVSYDPDTQILNVRIKQGPNEEEIEATMELDKMPAKGTVEIVLGEGRLAPRVEIVIHPRVRPPKFTSPEEADAWLEAHS